MVSLDEANRQGLVVGLKDVNDIKERLDIDVLMIKHPDTFNLLILALLELKGENVPWDIDPDFVVKRTDKMSYHQIAGIHGLPSDPWDGERGRKPEKASDPGYCTHGTPGFGSWHRPYLAMLEQVLYRQMANIVERFSRSAKVSETDKKSYRDALDNFRLPYWDYYRPRDGKTAFPGLFGNDKTAADYDYHVPHIFTTSQVMAKTLPDNEFVPVVNPFFNYRFAPTDLNEKEWGNIPSFKPTSEDRERTCRWGGDGPDNVLLLNNNLNKVREDQMRVILVMIGDKGEQANKPSYTNFLNFATNGIGLIKELQDKGFFLGPILATSGSIEGLHDNYHCYLGGFNFDLKPNIKIGHMMCVPIAAFDPVFWFHHCNIDRYFAIWQAVNPDHWFDDIPADHRLPVNDSKVQGPLSHWRDLHDAAQLPFRKAPAKSPTGPNDKWEFWTPDAARTTTVFGYRYPDLDPTKYPDSEAVREGFAARYGWNRRLEPWQKVGDVPEDMQPLDVWGEAQCFRFEKAPPSFEGVLPPEAPIQAAEVSEIRTTSQEAKTVYEARPQATVSREYFIDTVVEKMARNGAFTIFLFVGEVTGDSAPEWTSLPSYVGVAHIFAAPVTACDNCGLQAARTDRVTNTISMTSLLLDYVETGRLASMEPEDVKPFLVDNLKWKIQDADGVVVSGAEMSEQHSFRIGVSLKTSPLPDISVPLGEEAPRGDIERGFQDVIKGIIDNAKRAVEGGS